MKKDTIATPLPPFTAEEESILVEKLGAMDATALGHYVDCAHLALGNTALDPSWRSRVEIGLKYAEAAVLKDAAATASGLEEVALVTPPPPPAKAKKVVA